MTEETLEEKLTRYEFVIDAYVRELATLREENERLKATASAHQTLASIYSDPAQPTGHRIKAAGLALGVETPRLESVPPPLELSAEPVEPLAGLIARQRARADRMQAEMRDIEVSPSGAVRVLPRPGSNGNGDDSGGDHS
jgi:hypothetical protein